MGAFRWGDPSAPHADDIQAGDFIIAVDHGEWRHILADGGVALSHRSVADSNELMEARTSAEKRVVAHLDVSGEEDGIGEDIVIADGDIMGDVG